MWFFKIVRYLNVSYTFSLKWVLKCSPNMQSFTEVPFLGCSCEKKFKIPYSNNILNGILISPGKTFASHEFEKLCIYTITVPILLWKFSRIWPNMDPKWNYRVTGYIWPALVWKCKVVSSYSHRSANSKVTLLQIGTKLLFCTIFYFTVGILLNVHAEL